jgi:hypothetical protein
VRQLAREQRDARIEALRGRYAPRLSRLQERVRRAEARLERESAQYGQQKLQTAISLGTTVLGALFGRKAASASTLGRAATAARGAGRAAREREDIGQAEEQLEQVRRELAELERACEADLAALRDAAEPEAPELERVEVRARKSDVSVLRLVLVWTPWRVGPGGTAEPEFSHS